MRSAAAELGIPRVAGSWQEVVNDADVDAVCIGTWPYLHQRVACAALRAGKHVLCEARMSMDATEARAMLAASQAAPHLVAQLVPSPFTLRFDATIRRMLATGAIGQAIYVDVRGVRARPPTGTIRRAPTRAPGRG